MPYALTILWHERTRFLPAVLAVAFSATLIAVQCGLLQGLLCVASRPIDNARAELWIGSAEVPSVGFSQPIPQSWRDRLAAHPEIVRTEPYLFGFAQWSQSGGGTELCYVMGSRLDGGSLGAVADLTPELRARLTAPGTVVVDDASRGYLGLTRGVGETAEIAGRQVRVVGLLQRVKTIGLLPGVFCSLRTAQMLLPAVAERPDHTMYLLARCRRTEEVGQVVERLRRAAPTMTVLTSAEFSSRTRWHWLTKTKAGIHLGFCALLGLIVGAVVTSQTLYAATAASLREHAVLRALGIPRGRIVGLVLAQSLWVGLAGVGLGLFVILQMERLMAHIGLDLLLPPWLLAATAVLTLVMAAASGLAALRSLRLVDPIALLR